MKNIVFDWSGVIKDAFVAHLWVVNRIFRNHGLKELSSEDFRNNWEEPFMLFFNKYLPELTIDEERAEYHDGVTDPNYPKSNYFTEVVSLIKKINKENNYYIALLTSDLSDTIFKELKELGLADVFDNIVVKVHDKTEATKKLIIENNLDLQNTFIVGDSNNEIIAARSTNIKSIAVTWGLYTEEKLRGANPDFIVHNVEELKNIITDDETKS
jgi:phosphoglycolate phosphatase